MRLLLAFNLISLGVRSGRRSVDPSGMEDRQRFQGSWGWQKSPSGDKGDESFHTLLLPHLMFPGAYCIFPSNNDCTGTYAFQGCVAQRNRERKAGGQ